MCTEADVAHDSGSIDLQFVITIIRDPKLLALCNESLSSSTLGHNLTVALHKNVLFCQKVKLIKQGGVASSSNTKHWYEP